MLTPNGLLVIFFVFRISFRRSSGVGCVRAVSCAGHRVSCLCCGRMKILEVTHDTETTGIGNGGGELSVADPLHATLHNRDCLSSSSAVALLVVIDLHMSTHP